MTRNKEETKKRILHISEKLFSEKGYDATSVDTIAEQAEINKALIYYYFKNKEGLRFALFKQIIDQLIEFSKNDSPEDITTEKGIKKHLKKKITFLSSKKEMLSIMLMETFKTQNKDFFLLQSSEIVMDSQYCKEIKTCNKKEDFSSKDEYFIHDFFTAYLPIISFIVLQDKWAEYFKCDPKKISEHFINSFVKTHINSGKKKNN